MKLKQEISKYLGITSQQFEILKAIYMLESEERESNPKNIGEQYSENTDQKIQKPNLFNHLKFMLDKNILIKGERASYGISFEGIKKLLDQEEKRFRTEIEEFQKLQSESKDLFDEMIKRPSQTTVKYFDSPESYFNELNKYVEDADVIYTASPFANVSFTPMVASSANRRKYVDILSKNCFEDKKLKIVYLTQLDVLNPFSYAYQQYKNYESAFKECEIIINQLQNHIESQKMLEVYVDHPYGFDVLIIKKRNGTRHLFFYIRNEENIIIGGIYIGSPDVAKKAEQHFLRGCSEANKLTARNVWGTVARLRRQLRDLYKGRVLVEKI